MPKTWNADRLRFQLFTNYDKNLHPMMNEDNRTVVSIGLLLDYIDVSEHQGQMILHGWLSLVSQPLLSLSNYSKRISSHHLIITPLELVGYGSCLESLRLRKP